jgi:hypothetical protein
VRVETKWECFPWGALISEYRKNWVLLGGRSGVRADARRAGDTPCARRSADKKQVDVMTDPSTRYEKSGVASTVSDLKAGERVVVHGMKMSNGQVHAQLVKFGKPPAKGHA